MATTSSFTLLLLSFTNSLIFLYQDLLSTSSHSYLLYHTYLQHFLICCPISFNSLLYLICPPYTSLPLNPQRCVYLTTFAAIAVTASLNNLNISLTLTHSPSIKLTFVSLSLTFLSYSSLTFFLSILFTSWHLTHLPLAISTAILTSTFYLYLC